MNTLSQQVLLSLFLVITFTFNSVAQCDLAITSTVINLSCYNSSDGAIDLAVSTSFFPVTYDWSNGQIVEDIFGLPAGTYSVTVTDANNCTAVENIIIESPPELTLYCFEENPVSTSGGNDGWGIVNIEGGYSPYTIAWAGPSFGNTTGGFSDNILEDLSAGTYEVTVTDANGCYNTCLFTINEPDVCFLVEHTVTNPSCFGEGTGAIDITITDGIPPFIYEWSNGTNVEDPTGLFEGTYSVTITDANNCMEVVDITILGPQQLIVSCVQNTPVSGSGATDGVGAVNVSGGLGPYTISWVGPVSGTVSSNSGEVVLAGLAAGIYSATITDANGCFEECSFSIIDPNSICDIPIPTNIAYISGNVIKLNWTVIDGVDKYKIRYKENIAGSNWIEVSSTIEERFLNDLNPNSHYLFSFKTVCTTSSSIWSPNYSFTTIQENCDRPMASTVSTNGLDATIVWTSESSDIKYKLKYKPNGGAWTEILVNSPSTTLTALQANTSYKYKLKTKCTLAWTNWTAATTFYIASLTDNPNARSILNVNAAFPNPANDYINIILEEKTYLLQVFDINGNLFKEIANPAKHEKIDISTFPSGIYMVNVEGSTKVGTIAKFVKE